MRERFKAIYKRCVKHLDKDLGLLPLVWHALGAFLYGKWGAYTMRSLECYGVMLDPGPDEVRALVKEAAGDQAGGGGAGGGAGGLSGAQTEDEAAALFRSFDRVAIRAEAASRAAGGGATAGAKSVIGASGDEVWGDAAAGGTGGGGGGAAAAGSGGAADGGATQQKPSSKLTNLLISRKMFSGPK